MLKSFFSRPKDRTLTWKLNNSHSSIDKSKLRRNIQQAFDDWANHAGLTFREASENAKADFNLAFVTGEHADGFPLDGPGGTLAHAFYPWTPYQNAEKFTLMQRNAGWTRE